MTTDIYWPQNLEHFNYAGKLDCFMSYEEPDLDCNYHGAAYLIHAYAGGVEITDFLDNDVIKTIEREALCCYFSNS